MPALVRGRNAAETRATDNHSPCVDSRSIIMRYAKPASAQVNYLQVRDWDLPAQGGHRNLSQVPSHKHTQQWPRCVSNNTQYYSHKSSDFTHLSMEIFAETSTFWVHAWCYLDFSSITRFLRTKQSTIVKILCWWLNVHIPCLCLLFTKGKHREVRKLTVLNAQPQYLYTSGTTGYVKSTDEQFKISTTLSGCNLHENNALNNWNTLLSYQTHLCVRSIAVSTGCDHAVHNIQARVTVSLTYCHWLLHSYIVS